MSLDRVHGSVEIVAKDLELSYGRTLAMRAESLLVKGRVIGIIGHNGSGKSTLMKSMLELLQPKRGSIQASWKSDTEDYRLRPEHHMAFSPENGAVFEDLPVESYLRLWCRIKHNNGSYYLKQGAETIDRLSVGPLFKKMGRELSKGQRRRVMAAVGFLINPKLFLFDEPFDGLDIMQSAELASVMLEESRRMSMIVSSHRMDVVERIADTILVLRDGEVYTVGEVDDVCRELCGGSILISSKDHHKLAMSTLVDSIQQEFATCLVNQIGHQVIVTGTDAKLDSLGAFFNRQRIEDVQLDSVRPSLLDAMRYHLNKMH